MSANSESSAEPHGLLLFDKPAGITSHDAVARARRWLHTRRIGHAGTLDPMATGLMTLCVGTATRMAEYLTGLDKRYDALIRLGAATNTDDAEGEVLRKGPVPEISDRMIGQITMRFTGELLQTPPQFSAIKKAGVRAYVSARQGETVALDQRRVVIYELTIERVASDATALRAHVHCGSGTYIRALARDIGELLGCGAHLEVLRRTRVGDLSVDDALTEEQCAALAEQGELASRLQPMDLALAHTPQVRLGEADTRAVLQGRSVRVETADAPICRVYGPRGTLVAVGALEAFRLRPVKVFATERHAGGA